MNPRQVMFVALRVLIVIVVASGCTWSDISRPFVSPTPYPTVATPSPPPTQPPNTAIDWTTNAVKTTSTGVRVFSGTITNHADGWAVTALVVELKLMDGNGTLVQTLTASVDEMRPGDARDYTILVPASVRYELTSAHSTYRWIRLSP